MMINDIEFDKKVSPSDDLIFLIETIIDQGLAKEYGVDDILDERFKYIIEKRGSCEMSNNDDKFIAFAIRNSEKNSRVWNDAFLAAEIKIRPFVTKLLQRMYVDIQDYEDYYSDVRSVMLERISAYDSSIASLVTYLSYHIRHELYANRNTNSRYTSTIIKLARKAKDKLEEEGKPITNVTIAEYINNVTPLSRELSPKQIENALKQDTVIVELDDNISTLSSAYNPEASFLEKEYVEGLRHACDAEHWAVKTMYEIFKEYYLSDNPEQFNINETGKPKEGHRKKLPNDYLRQEMLKRTGVDFSDDRIENIVKTMADAIEKHGFGHRSKKSDVFIRRKNIDEFKITTSELDDMLNDLIAAGKI